MGVSCTTREPRHGEIDGVHYHFWTRKRFLEGVENDLFLEWAEYGGNLYGTLKTEVQRGTTTVLEIELRGARQVKALRPDAVLIMMWPSTLAALEANLRGRGDTSEESIQRRLKEAETEMREGPADMDFIILNKKGPLGLSRAVGQFRHILNTA